MNETNQNQFQKIMQLKMKCKFVTNEVPKYKHFWKNFMKNSNDWNMNYITSCYIGFIFLNVSIKPKIEI